MAQAAAVEPASEARINTFLARVYLLMFVGLAITPDLIILDESRPDERYAQQDQT